jgi:hypothetical protein
MTVTVADAAGFAHPQCQSARKRDPRSACTRDPLLVNVSAPGMAAEEPLGAAAAVAGAVAPSVMDQARFLNRQLSLPVSTMSQ